MDFRHSPKTLTLFRVMQQFMDAHIFPLEAALLQEAHEWGADWKTRQLDPRIEALKEKARAEGLWSLFLPEISGLSNAEYAPLAELSIL